MQRKHEKILQIFKCLFFQMEDWDSRIRDFMAADVEAFAKWTAKFSSVKLRHISFPEHINLLIVLLLFVYYYCLKFWGKNTLMWCQFLDFIPLNYFCRASSLHFQCDDICFLVYCLVLRSWEMWMRQEDRYKWTIINIYIVLTGWQAAP